MAGNTREIALLTNPTSGKGRGARARDAALPRLRDAGFVVRNLEGRDADEALDLARQCVADGVEALVVVGGDGMVHLGASRRWPTPASASGSSRPAPATTWPATSTSRARTPSRPPTG